MDLLCFCSVLCLLCFVRVCLYVLYSRPKDRGFDLTGVTALWSLSKTHYSSLVLVQPRETPSCLTERLLMGR